MTVNKQCQSLRTAVYILLTACAFVLLNGCKGSCTRHDADTQQDWTRPAEVTPEQILSTPVAFDEQSIEEAAQLANSSRTLTNTEIAQIIVTGESGAFELGQKLDALAGSDDKADVWNVVNELASTAWPKNVVSIIDGLEKQPLDAVENERTAGLIKAMEYNSSRLQELRRNVNNLPEIFEMK